MEPETLVPVGTVGIFKGYAELLVGDDGNPETPILIEGERVRIYQYKEEPKDGSFYVEALDGKPDRRDNLWPSEVTIPETTEPEAVAEAEAEGGVEVAVRSGNGLVEVTAQEEVAEVTPAKSKAKAKPTETAAEKKARLAAARKAKAAEKKAAKTEPKAEVETETETEAEVEAEATNETLPPESGSDIITDSVEVRSILDKDGALAGVVAMKSRIDESWFTLAGLLRRIKMTGLHKTAGFTEGINPFDAYCKSLGLHPRTVQQHIKIYEVLRRLNLDGASIAAAGIGWTKARSIADFGANNPELLQEHWDDIKEFARDNTREDLIAHMQTTYVDASDGTETTPKVKLTKVTFAFHADQITAVEQALALARTTTQNDDPAFCLEMILGEWLLGQPDAEVTLADAIATVELRYGVLLEARQPTEPSLDEDPIDMEVPGNGITEHVSA